MSVLGRFHRWILIKVVLCLFKKQCEVWYWDGEWNLLYPEDMK